MLEKNSEVINYPIGCLISEINKCYGCLINYLLDNMDEKYQVTDLILKSAVDSPSARPEFSVIIVTEEK